MAFARLQKRPTALIEVRVGRPSGRWSDTGFWEANVVFQWIVD
jgi:hypothetical protein